MPQVLTLVCLARQGIIVSLDLLPKFLVQQDFTVLLDLLPKFLVLQGDIRQIQMPQVLKLVSFAQMAITVLPVLLPKFFALYGIIVLS